MTEKIEHLAEHNHFEGNPVHDHPNTDELVSSDTVEDLDAATVDAFTITVVHLSPRQIIPATIGLVFTYIGQQQVITTVAPVIAYINADIGPIQSYTWMASAWSMSCAIFLALAGPLGDVLGRRYFFLGGNLLALLGSIIASTANNVETVIVGMAFCGAGAAFQQLALAAASEIYPNKYRGYIQALMENSALPFNAAGSLIAHKILLSRGWRFVLYLTIITNGTALITTALFYHPPIPYREITRVQLLKKMDWVGAGIYTAGLTSFLLGVSWAGGQYAWGSPAVIAPLVLGVVILVGLGFWEVYGAYNPLFPPHLFKNFRSFTNILLIVTILSMPLYALLFIWPLEVGSIYTTNPIQIGVYGLPWGIGTSAGSIVAGLVIRHLGRTNLVLAAFCATTSIFMGLYATLTPASIKPSFAYGLFAAAANTAAQLYTIVIIQFGTSDKYIGTATGLLACARSVGGALALSIYGTIITTKFTAIMPGRVSQAVVPLGLPESSIPGLLQALASGNATLIGAVPGVSPTIIAAATDATKLSFAAAFRIIYYLAGSLGAVSVALALLSRDVTPLMTAHLAVNLNEKQDLIKKEGDYERATTADIK